MNDHTSRFWELETIDSQHTRGVTFIAKAFENSEFITGHINGDIHLWKECRIKARTFIRPDRPSFLAEDDNSLSIVYISILNSGSFLSINRKGKATVWNMNIGAVIKTFIITWHGPDYFVRLPTNLLALSKYINEKSETVDIWNIQTGKCVHHTIQKSSHEFSILLGATISGLLVVAPCRGTIMRVWRINKIECSALCKTRIGRIHALAVLPTDEIVTASRKIYIYKLTQRGKIHQQRVIEHSNIIDIIIPIGGYKFLTVDRSRFLSGVTLLWNCINHETEFLGNSWLYGLPKLISSYPSLICSSADNKIFIKRYKDQIFRIPKNLVEIRKTARILAQASRTSSSLFVDLPVEVTIKIAVMTATDMNEYEQKVSEQFAWSHYGRPHICDYFIKFNDLMNEVEKNRSKDLLRRNVD